MAAGAGIAGTSCAARLVQLCPKDEVVLITADAQVQHASQITHLSPRVEDIRGTVTQAHAAAMQLPSDACLHNPALQCASEDAPAA
jgi:cation diffusion facilitator CzcD-associated flavoprotein CzcO